MSGQQLELWIQRTYIVSLRFYRWQCQVIIHVCVLENERYEDVEYVSRMK